MWSINRTAQPALQGLADSVDRCIAEASAAGLHETAALLHMAKLDLLTKIHGISDAEFNAFLGAARKVAGAVRATNGKPPRRKSGTTLQ